MLAMFRLAKYAIQHDDRLVLYWLASLTPDQARIFFPPSPNEVKG